MNKEELEEFLEKNNLIKEDELNKDFENEENCIFCLISSKKLDSCILKENEQNIAVLDLNPISEGNSLIIPKKHGKINENTLILAKEIKEAIEKNLSALEVKVEKKELFNHEIINLIPIYKGKELKKESKTIKELEEIKKKIIEEEKPNVENEIKEEKKEGLENKKLWLPKRIP